MDVSLAKYIRAARGPVLLMTLGVLLAINQSTRLTFDQTFPILIIVFGTMWLLERMVPRRTDPVITGGAPMNLPPMPPVERDPLFEDPALHVHREVYGAPARPSVPSPSQVAPKPMQEEIPTAEHPIRQQKPSSNNP